MIHHVVLDASTLMSYNKRQAELLKIIVHYPETPEADRELKKRIAIVHAEAAVRFVDKLPLTKDRKLRILEEVTSSRSRY